jgi:hypothetical protein
MRYAYFVVNLLVFTAACILSYNAHDLSEVLEGRWKLMRELGRKWDKATRIYATLTSKLNGLYNDRDSSMKRVLARFGALIRLYRAANNSARQGGKAPKCFARAPELNLPDLAAHQLQSITPDGDVTTVIRRVNDVKKEIAWK